ncbi:MAG: ATP-binding cassette domain-containing protein [Elusimicrobiota bacterium]
MNLLEIDGMTVVRGGKPALTDVSLAAGPGDCVVIFGRFGSGKHSFIQSITGVVRPNAGTLRIQDPRPEPRLPVAYVSLEGLLSNLTLIENAILPTLYHRLLSRNEARARAMEIFAQLGIAALAGHRPDGIGNGARRLAQVARALLLDPTVYVFDDPLEEIDIEAAQRVRSVLQDLKARAQSVVIVATTGTLRPYLDWAQRFCWARAWRVQTFAGKEELLACPTADLKVYLS